MGREINATFENRLAPVSHIYVDRFMSVFLITVPGLRRIVYRTFITMLRFAL